MKIKTGDKVKILSGKDRGKTGKVVQVLFDAHKQAHYVVVEALNTLKKHMRSSKTGEKGQVLELPTPLSISKVALLDPKSGKATRVGYVMEGTEKKRMAKVSGEVI